MRSLSVRVLLPILALAVASPAIAHDVTLSGTQSFASLDGSSSDHDGLANGVFTVSDGNLVIGGVITCNDDSGSDSACAMAFSVSGNLTMSPGSALYAENRTGTGSGGTVAVTVGGNLALEGNAIISTASRSSSGSAGGNIAMVVGGRASLAPTSTIDAGSSNAAGGAIVLNAAGIVTVDGNILSGPSRTFLATRLSGGPALDGGTSNSVGGRITLGSSAFSGPAVVVGTTASIVSQGSDAGAGPVTIDGCGVQVYGLVAALSRKAGQARVRIRSGRDLVVDGRDLGGSGPRLGRIRADAPTGTAENKGVDLFAAESIDIHGPSGADFVVTSLPGPRDPKSKGGVIRVTALGGSVHATGSVIDDGQNASGDTGGKVDISGRGTVLLDTAVIRAVGDFTTGNASRGGGSIRIRSYSSDVIWTNGTGEVRPVGSTSSLPLSDQGSIVLTACGTVDITGSTFPVMGAATSVFPEVQTNLCSPAAPSLPTGEPPLMACNTPPVANDTSVTIREDVTVAVVISGSDPEGDPLTFSIVSGPAHGSLGSVIATSPTTATVDYTPAANYHGTDSFVFRANDGNGGTDDAVATITVLPVNDAPSFLAGSAVTVLEDAGAQTRASWATGISAGPADESGQSVTFTVTCSNPSLFAVQPSLAGDGTLTFTAAANAYGSATLTIVAHDDGGTANFGSDTSAPQTSTITVTGVNDQPSFAPGASQTASEDAGNQTVSSWATAISSGPNETQALTFVVSNDNNALFSAQPSVAADGTLTWTPAADAYGSASVTVLLKDDGGVANGGDDTSAPQTFTITVNAVNDAPSFTPGGNVAVLEDSGPFTAAWATAVSSGPPNEAGQSVAFSISSNSNPGLFSVAPAVSSSGVLTFTPAPNAVGSTSLTIKATDNGGTANGGVDSSATVSFTVTIDAVNDAPSFLPGGNVTVNEDSGLYSALWAAGTSAGPNEPSQSVTFHVSNDNGALFSTQPAIDAAGVLTFTPAANAHGSATVTASLSDDGGTANGGVDTSAPVTFTIIVVSVNDAPAVVGESYETIGNTMLEVAASQTQSPAVFLAGSLLSNDSDIDGPNPLTASLVAASPGANVVINADGSFRYVPPAGFTGSSDSFMYSVTDGQAATTGTVTITVKSRVWYVSNNAGGTSGRSSDPFATLAAAESASTNGDTIYVFAGDGTDTGQNGGFVMKDAQRLLGAGVALTVPVSVNGSLPAVLAAAGPRPKLGNSGGSTVTAQNITAEIAGLDVTATLSGVRAFTDLSNAGSVKVHDLSVLGALTGIDIDSGGTGVLSVTVNHVSVVSTDHAFDAGATSGEARLAIDNSSFSSSAGDGIHLNGGGVVVTSLLNDSVSGNTFGNGLSVANVRFDALPGGVLDPVNGGNLTIGSPGNAVGGIGISLSNVVGNLDLGNLDVYADGPAAVSVAGSGPLTTLSGTRLGASSGSIAASAGAALSASNATLGLTLGSLVSTNSGSSGISLSAVTGSVSASSGSITNAVASDVNLVASSAAVSYSGGITDDLGPLVTIASATGPMTFNGPITDGNDGDGEGITLTNNTGATITFAGGLTLSTGTNPAFTATGGGTVNITGTNTAATTTAAAIRITNTSIGPSGVTFQSVNSTAPGSNTVIALDTTGSGIFSVTGVGTADGSGGTISNKIGVDAITLRNTAGPVTLRNMLIQDITGSSDAVDGADTRSGADGIQGEAVNGGLTLDNTDIRRISDSGVNGSAFSDPGAATATVWNGLVITNSVIEDTNRFGVLNRADASNEGAVHILGLKGVVSIAGSTFQRAGHGLDIDTDTSGSLDMTVQSSSFLDINKEMPGQLVQRVGLFGIDIRQLGSLNSIIRIGDPAESNTALGNTFSNDGLASIRIVSEPSATGNLQTVIARNQFSVTDHSSPGVPPGSFVFNFPQGGVSLRPRGTGRYEAIVAANTLDQLMHADGGVGELSIIIEGGDSEFIVRNNVFRLPWDGPVELRADGVSGTQNSAAVQFVNNQYIDGTIGSAGDDLGGPSPSPFTPFYVQVKNGGKLDFTAQGETFPQHDPLSGFGQSFVAQTTSAADQINLFLQNDKSPAGFRLNQVAGMFNLYRNGSAGGTATAVLQDNGNTGGGGSDSTVPPSVSTSGAITLSATAPVLPGISIP